MNVLKEENSALKKKNKELEDDSEMTCSSQADQLNKNSKDKIYDKKASALAYRNLEAERNRKLRQLTKRIGKLEAENSVILAKKKPNFNTRRLRLRNRKRKRTSRASINLESQIEQLHVVTRDNPLYIIPTKRTNLIQGGRVGATALAKF